MPVIVLINLTSDTRQIVSDVYSNCFQLAAQGLTFCYQSIITKVSTSQIFAKYYSKIEKLLK